MKVAFVLGTSTGGTARHVRMLAAGAAARGVSTEVFGPAQTDEDFAFGTIAGVEFTPVEIADRPRVRQDLRAVRRVGRLTAAWRPDVVHAHLASAILLSRVARPFAPVPLLVGTSHTPHEDRRLTYLLYRITNGLGDRWTSISRAGIEAHERADRKSVV